MKGILVIIDGLGDLPNYQLKGKTPLEAANTPNMDFLATRGEMGYMYTVKPGFTPGSEHAILSMFGNNPDACPRGQIEAVGAGVKLTPGDLVFRVNFGTIDSLERGNVIDRRAGRTLPTKEAKKLAKVINKIEFPYKFEFTPISQHRAVLVFHGHYVDTITGNDSTYTHRGGREIEKVEPCLPKDKSIKSRETAEMVNEFFDLVYETLKDHPINKKRVMKGLLPANYLFARGPGSKKPKLVKYKGWISTHAMPLEVGFSIMSGIKNYPFKYPKLKGFDVYKNLWAGLKKSVEHSKRVIKRNLKKADYCYVHFKEVDIPGHDNKPFEKKAMIEYIDKYFFKYLCKIAPMNKIKVVVTGDHSTPCKLKAHSSDPVPVLLYNFSLPKEKKHFTEEEARKGALKRIIGHDFLKKVGFTK
ncbi:2,3-bisphosphoglycerate-independent phosphoglycerate mutase [archaeon]|nr:2,3-bisphosphoglycerate-independent phosphoglycerate mutase [archaeon]